MVLLHVSNVSEMTISTDLEKTVTSTLVTPDALPSSPLVILKLLMEMRGLVPFQFQ